jgi:hypothetical protein
LGMGQTVIGESTPEAVCSPHFLEIGSTTRRRVLRLFSSSADHMLWILGDTDQTALAESSLAWTIHRLQS